MHTATNFWKNNCPECGSDKVVASEPNALVHYRCENNHVWIINPFSGEPIIVKIESKPDIKTVKKLTFYQGDRSDDDLWKIVANACRGRSDTWRAYEVLHGRFTHTKQWLNAYERRYAEENS